MTARLKLKIIVKSFAVSLIILILADIFIFTGLNLNMESWAEKISAVLNKNILKYFNY